MDTTRQTRTPSGRSSPRFSRIEILGIAAGRRAVLLPPYLRPTSPDQGDAASFSMYSCERHWPSRMLETRVAEPANDSMHLRGYTVTISRLVDDHAGHPAEDAGRSLGRRPSMIRSGVWFRAPSAVCRCRQSSNTFRVVHAQLRLRRVAVSCRRICLHRLGTPASVRRRDGQLFTCVELLGRGGMGEVWRGQHRAAKRGARSSSYGPNCSGQHDIDARNMLRRFEREAQATAALELRAQIRVFDFGVTPTKRSTT